MTVSSCQFAAELWICQRRQCCWSDVSQSLENCVPQVLWNLYDKWQPAPLRHLAVWKHVSARTMEGCVGTAAFCLSVDTSQFPCFTNVSKMFMLHEYQTQGFSFFSPHDQYEELSRTHHHKSFVSALTAPFPLPKATGWYGSNWGNHCVKINHCQGSAVMCWCGN